MRYDLYKYIYDYTMIRICLYMRNTSPHQAIYVYIHPCIRLHVEEGIKAAYDEVIHIYMCIHVLYVWRGVHNNFICMASLVHTSKFWIWKLHAKMVSKRPMKRYYVYIHIYVCTHVCMHDCICIDAYTHACVASVLHIKGACCRY